MCVVVCVLVSMCVRACVSERMSVCVDVSVCAGVGVCAGREKCHHSEAKMMESENKLVSSQRTTKLKTTGPNSTKRHFLATFEITAPV